MPIRYFRLLVCAAVCFFYASASAVAQGTTGSILGTVKDETGAVLPLAEVTVRNVGTGISRTVFADIGGRYRVTALAGGNYEATAGLQGFQSVVRTGIELTIGLEATMNFVLPLGEVTDEVTVAGEAPLIETTRAVIAGLVGEEQVRQLPLNARSLIELLPLQSGITFVEYGSQSASAGYAKHITVGGTRFTENLFQLDGININDRAGSAGSVAGVLMGVETIKEFSVIKNAYSAEYGRHTGGVLNAVTKSGTNELHGSTYEYLRDDRLDAKNFFDRDRVKPDFGRHQFGFSVGGPVVKSRTFFFGSYEGLREKRGVTSLFRVPNQNARNGLLPSGFVGVAGNVQPFLESYPLPNGQDFGDGTAELVRVLQSPTDEDYFTVRVDHQIRAAHSLFVRYTGDRAVNSDEGMMTLGGSQTTAHYAAIGMTTIFGSNVANKFLVGFAHSGSKGGVDPLAQNLPLVTFTDGVRPFGLGNMGQITIRGLTSWGGGGNRIDAVDSFQVNNHLSYSRGRHYLRFGGEVEKRHTSKLTGNFQRGGVYAFLSLQDFLRGRVNTFSGGLVDGVSDYRQWIYGIYAQDDIRLYPNFTLNVGLRFEPQGAFNTLEGSPNFRVDVTEALGLTVDDISVGNPVFQNPSLTKTFSPRIGFAWDPQGDQKTSVRGGFGVFIHQITAGKDLGSAIDLMPPNTVRGELRAATLGVPIAFPDAFYAQKELLRGVIGADPFQWEPAMPHALKWSLNLQRALAKTTTVEVDYSGTVGRDLLFQANFNVPIAAVVDDRLFIAPTAALRHPTLGRVRMVMTGASSSYHALGLTVNRRLSNGLQLQAAYTLAKAIDDASSTGADFSNDRNAPRYMDLTDRGLSPFDVRHAFTFNSSWALPGSGLAGVAGTILGGWQLTGVGRLTSGHPTSVSSGAAPGWFSNVEDYPDLRAGATIKVDPRNADQYFDPSVFVLQPPGFIGNLGRNTLTLPGIMTFDIALRKDFAIRDKAKLSFRSEVYNLFDRANFGMPNTTVFASTGGAIQPTAGRITTTTTTARQIQFGVRLEF